MLYIGAMLEAESKIESRHKGRQEEWIRNEELNTKKQSKDLLLLQKKSNRI